MVSNDLNRGQPMALRTEKEKMLAGESYNCLDPGLEAERQQIKKLLWRFNGTEAASERQFSLRQLLGQIGENTLIEHAELILSPSHRYGLVGKVTAAERVNEHVSNE